MTHTTISKKRTVGDKLLALARHVETDRGLLVLIWTLRLAALFGVTAYFVASRSNLNEPMLFRVQATLLAFFAYLMISGVGGIYYPDRFLSRKVKLAQVVIEIGLYSVFYYLTQDTRSEVYFLLFLPLFVAARYLGTRWTLIILGLTSMSLYIVLANIAASLGDHFAVRVYLTRELLVVGITLFYVLRNRSSVIVDLQEEKSQLISAFKGFTDGVYVVDTEHRLLFVNDLLREKHGPYTSGQTCSSYFLCEDGICGWCPLVEDLTDPVTDLQRQQGKFIDRDGHSYQVEVSSCPLPGKDGKIVGAIAFVRDVSKERELEQRLTERLQGFARRIRALTSERARWLETYYEMGKRLAGFGDLEELMQFVVEETMDRLNAETSALFLLENDRLVRKAIAGVEGDWFAEESYGIGEGITGQAVVPPNGEKYGRPILANDVDENPLVIPLHLIKYEQRLDTHEVKHLIAVPLNGQEGSFGVLRVVNKLDRRGRLSVEGFQREDVDFMVTIASMVAIAIENTRLLGEAIQRYQEISTLFDVGQRITRMLDRRELLQVIVDQARVTIPDAVKATIHLIDPQTGMLLSEAVSEPNGSVSGIPPLHRDEGIAGRAIKEKRTVYVPDTREDPDFRDRGTTVLSLLVTPLMVDDRVIGTLSLDSDQPDAFTPDNRRLLETLAAHAAIAIEKAQLYKRERERRHLADTLREVSRAVNSSLDLEEVLQHILNELGKVVAYDSASIQLVEGNQLKIIACRGFDEPDKVRGLTFPMDNRKFPNYEVMVNKSPHIVGDVRRRYPHFVEEAEKYQSMRIRSWLGVPLIHRDRVIGMISLDSEVPDYYAEESASLALTFANQVAIAIINAQLFKETQQQMEELDTLYQASQVVTSSLDIEEVLGRIVSLAGDVANSDHTGVVLVGEEGRLVTSVEDHEVGAPLHVRARPNGITRQVVNARKSIFFDEVEDDGVTHNPVVVEQGFKSYGGVPIIARGKVQGVLFVHSFKAHAFKGYSNILAAFCNHAAIAIENARLFKEVEQQAQMLENLLEASRRLIQHTSLQELQDFCVHMGATIFDVEDCSISVVSEERETIDLVASSSIPPEVWTKREAPIDGPGLTAYVARTGETLNFGGDEYKEHPEWAGRYGEPFLEHLQHLPSKRCHSLLVGPLQDSKGRCIGVLKLENKRGGGAGKRFSPFEVAMHETFASYIGMAIERARLYDRLDEEARRRARESLSDDLHDTMNVLHGTLVLGTAYCKELMGRGDYATAARELDKMGKAAKHTYESLRRLHQDVRDPAFQEKGLIPALRHYASMLPITRITFQTIGREKLPSEIEYALYKIAQEALSNAAKHAQLGKQGNVQVVLRKTGQDFDLTIRDTGVGFDTESILNKDDAFGFQNMCRWAESMDAQLEITSQPGRGTCVQVRGRGMRGGSG